MGGGVTNSNCCKTILWQPLLYSKFVWLLSYSGEEKNQKNKAISVFEFMSSLQNNNPYTWVLEQNKFGRTFLGYLYFLLTLSVFLVFDFMTSPQHKNPYTWYMYHKLYNFGRPFLGHLYFLLSLSHLRAKENSSMHKFSTLIQNHYFSSFGKGLKFTISHLFPIHVIHIKMKKKSPSNFRSCFLAHY